MQYAISEPQPQIKILLPLDTDVARQGKGLLYGDWSQEGSEMHAATLILSRCSRITHDLAVLLFNLCHCPGITLVCCERLVVICDISPHCALLPTLIPAPQSLDVFQLFLLQRVCF